MKLRAYSIRKRCGGALHDVVCVPRSFHDVLSIDERDGAGCRAAWPPFLQQQSQSFFLSSSFGEMDGGEAIHCSSPLCLMRHGSRKKQGEEMSSSSSSHKWMMVGYLIIRLSTIIKSEKKRPIKMALTDDGGCVAQWALSCAAG